MKDGNKMTNNEGMTLKNKKLFLGHAFCFSPIKNMIHIC